ncbi:hypothetical protein BXY41_103456 [Lacrimispora xylanisolvens]|uniref:Uncharacterized protein n=1 Tax=Lacrimispora xylanisolvens TaxID=384636 RepID=A0A2S6HWC0_9FIRM|nr:hypothetical protein [Hungatella xylanolytica]PPK82240.1 hypothetical protein BXY41_103456 [Hungatella xylanolytica]
MKRFLILLCMILVMSFPSYADVKQIPARPKMNAEYYQYYALFYRGNNSSYYLFYSPTSIVYASTSSTYVAFSWTPGTSDDWVQLSSFPNIWGYLTYLSGNGDVMTSSGTVKYTSASDTVFTEHAKANFSAYSDYWDNSSGGDDDPSPGIISGLRNVVNAISSLPGKIGNSILDILKSLFIPADGYLEEKINYLVQRFKVAFGITPYDMSGMFSSEKALADIKITIYGVTATVVEMDYVIEALAVFRKIIRGFICLLLLFYNINQFLGFIGQAPITLGALIGIKNHMERSEDS